MTNDDLVSGIKGMRDILNDGVAHEYTIPKEEIKQIFGIADKLEFRDIKAKLEFIISTFDDQYPLDVIHRDITNYMFDTMN